jgi:hypothetical protein
VTTPFDVVVVGASLGGTVAAWRAASSGLRTLLLAEHARLGGQLSAQAVPPDEHPLIEHGGASASYLAFREHIRKHFLSLPDFVDNTSQTEGTNPGDGWVSRLCFPPQLADEYLRGLLAPLIASGRLTLWQAATCIGTTRTGGTRGRRIESVRVKTASSTVDVPARWFLDATDTGELISLAGLPYRVGKESKADFGERDAPERADPLDQQPITAVIALRRGAHDQPAGEPIPKPASYDFWARYVLPHYGYPLFSNHIPGRGRGQSVVLPWFGEGKTLDLWRYRRVVAAHQWRTPRAEVSLINWAQNDYNLAPLLDGAEHPADVDAAARELSLCFAHYLQTEAQRPDGGRGYADLALAPDITGTPDGIAQQIYVRESRRIISASTLTQTDIASVDGDLTPHNAADTVGTVWYNMDIHPTCVSGDGVNARVRPFTLPLGVFVGAACDNLIPACKNIGVTHLVNAATRVHPAEWLIGEVAALLCAQAHAHKLTPGEIHRSPSERAALQAVLVAAGIPLEWSPTLMAKLNTQQLH